MLLDCPVCTYCARWKPPDDSLFKSAAHASARPSVLHNITAAPPRTRARRAQENGERLRTRHGVTDFHSLLQHGSQHAGGSIKFYVASEFCIPSATYIQIAL